MASKEPTWFEKISAMISAISTLGSGGVVPGVKMPNEPNQTQVETVQEVPKQYTELPSEEDQLQETVSTETEEERKRREEEIEKAIRVANQPTTSAPPNFEPTATESQSSISEYSGGEYGGGEYGGGESEGSESGGGESEGGESGGG
jgi:hypothetical protein